MRGLNVSNLGMTQALSLAHKKYTVDFSYVAPSWARVDDPPKCCKGWLVV